MATILTHPALGDKPFGDAHAKRIMAMVNNGGWEFKKQGRRQSPPAILNQDDAANIPTDQGETRIPEEKGDN